MKGVWLLASSLLVLSSGVGTERRLVDEIIAIVPHKDGAIVLCMSDLRLGLEQGAKTIRTLICEALLIVAARDLGVVLTKQMVESIVQNIQRQLKISADQLNELFAQQGLTVEEAHEMIKRRRMMEEVLSVAVKLEEPSHEDIIAYHQAHATVEPAVYTVQPGFVALSAIAKPEITRMLQSGKSHRAVEWYTEDVVPAGELSDVQQFITTMKEGEIRLVGTLDDGYELIRLVRYQPEHQTALDEVAVAQALRAERYGNSLLVYQQTLIEKAPIRWCSSEWQAEFERECGEVLAQATAEKK